MKFLFFDTKKEKLPNPHSLKSKIFDVEKYWNIILIIFFILSVTLGAIGARYAYFVYSGNYTGRNYTPDFSNLIKEVKLKTTIEQRMDFINSPFEPIRNPSN